MSDFRTRLNLALASWVAERVHQVRISDILYRDTASVCLVCGISSGQLIDLRRAIIVAARSSGDRWLDDQREDVGSLLRAGVRPEAFSYRSVLRVDGAQHDLASLMSVPSRGRPRKLAASALIPPPAPFTPPVYEPTPVEIARAWLRDNAPGAPLLVRDVLAAVSWLRIKRRGRKGGRQGGLPPEVRRHDFLLPRKHRLQPADMDRLHAFRVDAVVASEADCKGWFCAREIGVQFAAQRLGLGPKAVRDMVARVDRLLPYGERVVVPGLIQVERGLWSMVLWRDALLVARGLPLAEGPELANEGVNFTPEWLLRACLHHGAERLALEGGVVSLAWAGLESVPGASRLLTPSSVRAWLGQVERLLIEGCECPLDLGWRAEPSGLRPRRLPDYVELSPSWIDEGDAAALLAALHERIASARQMLRDYRQGSIAPSFD